jgi:sugar lactone lactonase YvrE
MRWGGRAAVCVLLLGALLVAASVAQAQTATRAFSVFARVPEPGQPEGLAVAQDGTVYAGTDVAPFGVRPEGIQPAKVFAFTPNGQLKRAYTILGETYAPWYGLFGLAVDGDGIVYALDHNPPRVLAIDPVTGGQTTYASFHQVTPCSLAAPGAECKDTTGDNGSFPNFIVFAPDGTMYVTDTSQALIWRIPRGGQPQVWYTNPGLETLFGPNDLALTPDGHTLLFGFSQASYNGQLSPGLYALPILADGRPGQCARSGGHSRSTSPRAPRSLTRAGSTCLWAASDRSSFSPPTATSWSGFPGRSPTIPGFRFRSMTRRRSSSRARTR